MSRSYLIYWRIIWEHKFNDSREDRASPSRSKTLLWQYLWNRMLHMFLKGILYDKYVRISSALPFYSVWLLIKSFNSQNSPTKIIFWQLLSTSFQCSRTWFTIIRWCFETQSDPQVFHNNIRPICDLYGSSQFRVNLIDLSGYFVTDLIVLCPQSLYKCFQNLTVISHCQEIACTEKIFTLHP